MKKRIFSGRFLSKILHKKILDEEKIKELNENDPIEGSLQNSSSNSSEILKNNTERINEINFGNQKENENVKDNIQKQNSQNENIKDGKIKNSIDDINKEGPIKILNNVDFLNNIDLLDQQEQPKTLNVDDNNSKIQNSAIMNEKIRQNNFKQNSLINSDSDNSFKKNDQQIKVIDKNKDESEHYEGHRKRLRDKVLENGPTILKDYELLEILLTYSIPRSDTKPLAKNLLAHFKSLQSIFLSDKAKLSKIKGLGESSICFLNVIHEITCRMAKEEIIDQVLLNTPEKVINYCRLRMSGLSYEQFYVLFLNRKNKLILDEPIQSGTIDKAAIFPRELVKRAIDLGAGAMILIHNHPSGDPTPSKADVETTINIQKAANLMEIFLYDHIIIGKNTHYSMRSNKIL